MRYIRVVNGYLYTRRISPFQHTKSKMSSTHKVTLLSASVSPFSMRAKLALTLKNIEHEDLPQDLSNKSKLLLDSNPIHKKVPVLIHNGNPVVESAIIVQYIDEAWPEKSPLLLPQDAFLRAEHRFWTDFIDKKMLDCLMRFIRGNESANDEFIANWELLEGALAKLGGEGPFFGGHSMSIVDVILAPYTIWVPAVVGVLGLKTATEEQCPHLHRWMAAISELPAAEAALPPVEKVENLIRARLPVWRKP